MHDPDSSDRHQQAWRSLRLFANKTNFWNFLGGRADTAQSLCGKISSEAKQRGAEGSRGGQSGRGEAEARELLAARASQASEASTLPYHTYLTLPSEGADVTANMGVQATLRQHEIKHVGCFATAEEAALCVACSPEEGQAAPRSAAAPPLTSEDALQQARDAIVRETALDIIHEAARAATAELSVEVAVEVMAGASRCRWASRNRAI